jgi:hypothetical protein
MQFRLPIGDWSADGHGKCEWFFVQTTGWPTTIERVREAWYRVEQRLCDRTNTILRVSKICNGYEEYHLQDREREAIQQVSVWYPGVTPLDDGEDHDEAITPEQMALWICQLLTHVGECPCELIPEAEVPMLPFYGVDEAGRHLSLPGYGLLT